MLMSPSRDWILFLTVITALVLAVTGAFMYPLNEMELLFILIYELIVIMGSLSILVLIYKKSIE